MCVNNYCIVTAGLKRGTSETIPSKRYRLGILAAYSGSVKIRGAKNAVFCYRKLKTKIQKVITLSEQRKNRSDIFFAH